MHVIQVKSDGYGPHERMYAYIEAFLIRPESLTSRSCASRLSSCLPERGTAHRKQNLQVVFAVSGEILFY